MANSFQNASPLTEQLESRLFFSSVSAAASLLTGNEGIAGTYFQGTSLTPIAQTNDAKIDFNWRSGRPLRAITGKDFHVNWAGQFTPAVTGTYTFYTNADSGTSITINGVTLFDNSALRTPSLSSGSVALTAGVKALLDVTYYSRGSADPRIQLLYSVDGSAKRVVPSSALNLVSPASLLLPPQPLTGYYFVGPNFNKEVLTEADTNINSGDKPIPVELSEGYRPFSVRWIGTISAPATGTYTLRTVTDDGVRLWVDGGEVINKFYDQSADVHTATVTLTAGQIYNVRMDYYENGVGPAKAQLFWTVPGTTTSVLVPFSNPLPAAPLNLAATAVSGTEIDLTWTANSATSPTLKDSTYYVERSSDGGATFTQIATIPVGANPQDSAHYADMGLSPSTTYTYEIIAQNSAGNSPPSNLASATTLATVPTPVTASIASYTTNAVVTWIASPTATSYLIERSLDQVTYTPLGTTSATSFTDETITPPTQTGYYRVTAINASGSSPVSNVVHTVPTTNTGTQSLLTNIYGLTNNSTVYTIDPASGAATQIGNLAFGTNAASRDPVNGNLYYFSTATNVVQVDQFVPATGINGTAGTVTLGNPVAQSAFRSDRELFVSTDTGDLFAFTAALSGGQIGTLHANGAVLATGNGDMAFAPDGTLFIETNSELFSVSAAAIAAGTGPGSIITATDIGHSSTGNLQLAFAQSGVLFGTDANGQLYTINTTTAAATVVGAPTGIDYGDLASTPLYSQLTVAQTPSTLTHAANGSYTFTVTNAGPNATQAPIGLVDTLAAGTTFVGETGTGWTYTTVGQTVTLTYTNSVTAGATPPAVTLNIAVAASAPTTVTNTVTANIDQFQTNSAGSSNTVTTPIG